MKKYILITLIAVGALVLGTSVVKADEVNNYPPIVQKLVERFGLNETEVREVFDEVRGERRAEMQAKHEERLNQAVSDGIITEEQKTVIMTKHEQMKVNRGNFKDLTQEERQTQREIRREEMKIWVEGQGIDLKELHQSMGGPGKGFGRGFRLGQNQ